MDVASRGEVKVKVRRRRAGRRPNLPSRAVDDPLDDG